MGIELTDEAFYVSESYLVQKGAVPFVDNWTQSPGFTFLTSALTKIFTVFSEDTEGIFLYMRGMFFLYRLIFVGLIYILFHKRDNKELLLLCCMALIPYWYSFILNFSYNTVSLSGILFTSVLLLYGKNINNGIVFFTMGMVMALTTMSYPSQIFNCLVYIGLIVFFVPNSNRNKAIINYIGGGLITALIIMGWLIFKAGSIEQLLHGLNVMVTENAYFNLKTEPFIEEIIIIFKTLRTPILLISIGFLLHFGINFILISVFGLGKKKKDLIFRGIYWGIIFGLLGEIYIERGRNLYINTIVLLFVGAILLSFFEEKCKRVIWIILLPELVLFFVMVFTVYGGVQDRFYIFYPTGILAIYYTYKYLLSIGKENEAKIKSLFMAALYVVFLTVFSFSYFYREVGIEYQTTKVAKGVYKGIYTSDEQANAIIHMEEYIKEHTLPTDRVLFMEVVPFAYLMSDSDFCTPSTWDIMLYSYGFNDDTIMHEYFRAVGQYPNKIMYIDTGRDERLSIDVQSYKFTEFVKRNYKCTDKAVIDSKFKVQLYEIK